MVVNYLKERLDFANEYKRYILKKRQAAYDEAEKILVRLSIRRAFQSGFVFCDILYEKENLIGFVSDIETTVMKNRVWFSNEITNNLNAIRELFNKIVTEVLMHDQSDFTKRISPDNSELYQLSEEEIKKIETTYNEDMTSKRKKFYQTFFRDIKELDNITRFKNKILD